MGAPTLEPTADITSPPQHSSSRRLGLRPLQTSLAHHSTLLHEDLASESFSALYSGIHIHLITVPSKPQKKMVSAGPFKPWALVLSGTWEELKDKGVLDLPVCWCEILEGLRNLAQMPPL